MKKLPTSYHNILNNARAHQTKIIALIGPTASGKSELAVQIAKEFNGEIISADSRQIYRGLDIGSTRVPGKWQRVGSDPPKEGQTLQRFIYKTIPHHCLDFVSPEKTYTVAEFKKRAECAIKKIIGRGKTPIIVGGTGLWVDTLVYDMSLPEVPPNKRSRKNLSSKNMLELLAILKKLDPNRARNVDAQNPRRLIRAIEVARALGKVPLLKKQSPYRALWLGLNPPPNILDKRIRDRARKMIQKGIIKEAKKLLTQGVPRSRLQEFGFEYRAALDYIDQKITKDELYARLVRDTLRYAKRQMRWFKRNPEIHWITKLPVRSIKEFLNT